MPTGWRAYPFPLRLLVFLGILALAWLPFVGLGWWLFPQGRDYLWLPLYGLLLGWLWLWGEWRGSQGFATYGLDRSWACRGGILQGLVTGCGGLLLLFVVEGWFGWLAWRSVGWGSLLGYGLLGLLLGLAVALVEELFFRGWMLEEMALDYGLAAAGWGSSLLFAVAHFLKPLEEILATWPQFPGLWLMGLLLVQARLWTQRRLGLSLGLHAGWVWGIAWVNNVGWFDYTGRAPEWVTGIGENPLAGLMGVLSLGVTFVALNWLSQAHWLPVDVVKNEELEA
ncbi:MAG: type II CAAX endopeptidase family protein [Thermostichus sp. HHBFW_bins_43]